MIRSRPQSIENIRFWCIVNDFHKNVDLLRAPTQDGNKEDDENDFTAFAEDVFNTYVKVGSDMQINISSAQLKSIETDIAKPGRVERSLFDKAQKEVYNRMNRDSYRQLLIAKNQEDRYIEQKKKGQAQRSCTVKPT